MPDFTVTFEVYCKRCGAGLCDQSVGGNTKRRGMPHVDVEPCEQCVEKATAAAYESGYEDAQRESEDEAR